MSPSHICPNCGQASSPKTKQPSNFIIEVIVWVLCLAFGQFVGYWTMLIALSFSLWRQFSKTGAYCAFCNQDGMIPVNTPKGMALQEQYKDTQQEPVKDVTGY